MMSGLARRAAVIGTVLLVSGAFGTAWAVPGTPPSGPSSAPWLKSPGPGSAAEGSTAERPKPEAAGRVIKRERQAEAESSAQPNSSAIE
jgi:hypothetical protein